MGNKNRNWERVLEIDEVQNWCKNTNSTVFQLKNDHFKSLGFEPVRMIPSYSSNQLPRILKENGLELLRNQVGGCLLVKTGLTGLKTLFPNLEKPTYCYEGNPLRPISRLSLLKESASKLAKEESGIHLGWAMGVIQSFLMEMTSPYEEFSFLGRLKTTAVGGLQILGRQYDVDTQVEVDAYFESNNQVIVLEAKQSSSGHFKSNFSLHQLILPLILVRSSTKKPSNGVFMDWALNIQDKTVEFRFYNYEFSWLDIDLDPFSYRLRRSKRYIIDV